MGKQGHVIIMAVWAALLVVVAVVVFWDRLFPAEESAPDTPPPARLAGTWRRGDGGYVLDIRRVHDDGTLEAAYLNPDPIHVSKANTFTFGVGDYYLDHSNEFSRMIESRIIESRITDEQGVEVFYNIEVTPWLHITPDIQTINPMLERADTAVVAGVRVKIDL